jgi:hypothetical protein
VRSRSKNWRVDPEFIVILDHFCMSNKRNDAASHLQLYSINMLIGAHGHASRHPNLGVENTIHIVDYCISFAVSLALKILYC